MRVFEYGLLSSSSDWRMSELSDRLIPNLSNEPFDFVLGCVFDQILPWWWSDIKVSYVFHHVLAKKSFSPFAMVTWGSGGQLDEWQTVTRGEEGSKSDQFCGDVIFEWPLVKISHFSVNQLHFCPSICPLITSIHTSVMCIWHEFTYTVSKAYHLLALELCIFWRILVNNLFFRPSDSPKI